MNRQKVSIILEYVNNIDEESVIYNGTFAGEILHRRIKNKEAKNYSTDLFLPIGSLETAFTDGHSHTGLNGVQRAVQHLEIMQKLHL